MDVYAIIRVPSRTKPGGQGRMARWVSGWVGGCADIQEGVRRRPGTARSAASTAAGRSRPSPLPASEAPQPPLPPHPSSRWRRPQHDAGLRTGALLVAFVPLERPLAPREGLPPVTSTVSRVSDGSAVTHTTHCATKRGPTHETSKQRLCIALAPRY